MFIDMMELDALKPQQTSVMFLLCPFRVVSSHNEVSCSREEVERYHQSRGRCNNPIPGDVSIEMWRLYHKLSRCLLIVLCTAFSQEFKLHLSLLLNIPSICFY